MTEIALKRWSRFLFLMGLGMAVFLVAGKLIAALNTPVTVVKIDGNLQLAQRQQITNLIQPQLARGFIGLDLKQLVRTLRNVSWVRGIEVRKEWPGTLHLKVANQYLVAQWGDDMFLNNSGRIVGGHRSSTVELPHFYCHQSTGIRAMRVYETLRQILKPVGLRIKTLLESDSGNWSLVLNNNVRVVLGVNHLVSRAGKFVLVYQNMLADQDKKIEFVDARYENGVAVHWSDSRNDTNPHLLAANISSGG